ncbi:hypothetical protein [Rhodococcus sp. KRD162]|jgi:hypothetical protein|uniref:hypothetical protein n=1 Tax=Rhodococcus sp. KRD162 TaxID=2729725 RepID=UPI0019D1934E|nr:hypothetical protein [Rhodococcus sp. KRD162]
MASEPTNGNPSGEDNDHPNSLGLLSEFLWPIEKVADHWGVSQSRARALLASRRIKRVSGYPADQVRGLIRRQGARTDQRPSTPASMPETEYVVRSPLQGPQPARVDSQRSRPKPLPPHAKAALGPIPSMIMECLADGEVWTPTRIAVTVDPSRSSEESNIGMRDLVLGGMFHLDQNGYAVNEYDDGWQITEAGRNIIGTPPEA